MKKGNRNKIISEALWLLAILTVSAVIEYSIIEIFDLHPILSVKLQGLIGLLVIGYSIRMATRLWNSYKADSNGNSQSEMELKSDRN